MPGRYQTELGEKYGYESQLADSLSFCFYTSGLNAVEIHYDGMLKGWNLVHPDTICLP